MYYMYMYTENVLVAVQIASHVWSCAWLGSATTVYFIGSELKASIMRLLNFQQMHPNMYMYMYTNV